MVCSLKCGESDGCWRWGSRSAPAPVLSADYFTIPEEEIRGIESVLTIVGGKVVYGAQEFGNLAPLPCR